MAVPILTSVALSSWDYVSAFQEVFSQVWVSVNPSVWYRYDHPRTLAYQVRFGDVQKGQMPLIASDKFCFFW